MTANLETSESKEGAMESISSLNLLKGKTNNIQRGDLLTIAAIQLNSTVDQKDRSCVAIEELLINSAFDSIDQNQKQDKKEESKGQAKSKDATEGEQSSLGASGADPIDSGVNALFGVSEKLKKTQQKACKSEEQAEHNQEVTQESVTKNELAEAKKIQSFMDLMETFLTDNPSNKDGNGYVNFEDLMDSLIDYCKQDPKKLGDAASYFKMLKDQAKGAYKEEKKWEKMNPWQRFWSGKWNDPQAWSNFVGQVDIWSEIMDKGLITNPQLLQDLKNNMYKAFDRLLEGLKGNLKNLERIEEALQQKGSALFALADIMTQLTQAAAQNSGNEIKRKGVVSKANLKELEKNYKKITEDINKEIENKKRAHSFFGAICNFFSSVVNDIAKIVHAGGLICTGHEAEGWKELGEATGLGYLVESAIKLLEDVCNGKWNQIGGDLKDFGEEFATASLALLCGGVVGLMANGAGSKDSDKQEGAWIKGTGSFHGDAKGLVDMGFHALVMLLEVSLVALANIGSLGLINADKSMRKEELKILKDAGKNGEDIITNPEFKLVMDLAMIAMTVATAWSGGLLSAGVMAVMFLLQEQIPGTDTSVLQMATDGLTKAFHGNALAADALIMGITTAITLGASFSSEIASAASAAASRVASAAAQVTKEGVAIATLSVMRGAVNLAYKTANVIVDMGVQGWVTAATIAGSIMMKGTAEAEGEIELTNIAEGVANATADIESESAALSELKETATVSDQDREKAAVIFQKFARRKLAFKKVENLRAAKAAAAAKRAAVVATTEAAINTSNQDTKSATMQGIKKFGKGAAAISLGVGTGMGMTSFGADLAKAIDPKNKELQMILGIVSEITATILAIAGGVGLSKLSNLTESVTKDQFSFFKKLMPNMDSIDERQMSRTALMLQAGAAVTQASGEVGNALQEIKTAEITADIQERQAIVQELDEMEKMNNKKMEKEEAHMQTILKGFQKKMDDIQNAIVGPAEALARALSESV